MRLKRLIAATILLAAMMAARPIRPSLIQMTRSAPVIVMARVESVGTGTITAKTIKMLKGSNIPERLSLSVNSENVEGAAAHLNTQNEIGKAVVIFAKPVASGFEVAFDGNGIVSEMQFRNAPQSLESYAAAIGKVMEYDAASSSAAHEALLVDMLKDGYFSQEAATQIIYLEVSPQQYHAEGLVAALLELGRDSKSPLAVPAIQALGRIGGKPAIPELIRLMSSENFYARQTAANIVKDKTRAGLEFDPAAPEEQRTEQIRQWSQWWQKNKERVQLHY